jgi:hypothetical protein
VTSLFGAVFENLEKIFENFTRPNKYRKKKHKNGTHYLLDRFDFGGGPLVEFGIIELSTELDGFVSLSGGSLRFFVLYVARSTLTVSGMCGSDVAAEYPSDVIWCCVRFGGSCPKVI